MSTHRKSLVDSFTLKIHMQMRKSVPIMKALITVLFGIGVCSRSTTRITEVGESTPKLDSMEYYIFQEEYDECSTSILELSYKDGKVATGYFWGTSDEFSEAREGYYPWLFRPSHGEHPKSWGRLLVCVGFAQDAILERPHQSDVPLHRRCAQERRSLMVARGEGFPRQCRLSSIFFQGGHRHPQAQVEI